ncbi:cytochrome c3 family protein [Neobacillus cucumis]|uniref:cytochrome c3 family protein n=1 Tax=Neobacillus cucumis TaxID=1740721 RepID=UPI002E1E527D|nr:cytochrome c3 family protein [Neobacillus cucumis]
MTPSIHSKNYIILIVLLFFCLTTIIPTVTYAEEQLPTANPSTFEETVTSPTVIVEETPTPTNGSELIKATTEEADTVKPSIIVKNITLQSDGITVSGTISDNQPTTDTLTMNLIYPDGQKVSLVPDNGEWSFKTVVTAKLNHYKIEAIDAANNTTEIFVQRPYIKSITMNVFKYRQKDYESPEPYKEEDVTANVNILESDNITRVSLNQTIIIELSDTLTNSIDNNHNPFIINDKNGKEIPFDIDYTPLSNKITLTNQVALNPGETYYLRFNPSLISLDYNYGTRTLVDDLTNPFYSITKQFTTVSNAAKNFVINAYTVQEMNNLQQLPHGSYNNNVNNCTICHNTHEGGNTSLENKDLAQGYCMACHDGTTGPKMVNFDSSIKSKHETQKITNHDTKSGSCTACHNPHLTWSEDNPNLLNDHYVYDHKAEDTWEGNAVGKIDSNIQLCEACHGRFTYSYKSLAEESGGYNVLHYRQETTAIGNITETQDSKNGTTKHVDDYDLCFTCHNSEKQLKGGTTDILTYYTNQDSKHIMSALDGSKLNGQLPCSECHDTHASNNILLLKNKLGHENQQSFSLTKIDDWTGQKKREYCLTCHNGKTVLYGVTEKAIYDETGQSLITTNDTVKAAHAKGSTEVCSDCHSNSGSFTEAVHAPIIKATP